MSENPSGPPRTPVARNEADLLTAAEVAALLRVSKMTVYRLVDTGQLTSMRIGRSHRITRAALRTYLAGTYAPAAYETAREA